MKYVTKKTSLIIVILMSLSFFNCKKENPPLNQVLAKIVNADNKELVQSTNLKIVSYYYDGGFFSWGPPKSKSNIIHIQTGLLNIEAPNGSCKEYHSVTDENWFSLWYYDPYCADGYDTIIFEIKQKILANINIIFQDSIQRSSCVEITRIDKLQSKDDNIIANRKVSSQNIKVNSKTPSTSFKFKQYITINDSLNIKISYRKNQLVTKHFKIQTTSIPNQSFIFKL